MFQSHKIWAFLLIDEKIFELQLQEAEGVEEVFQSHKIWAFLLIEVILPIPSTIDGTVYVSIP